MIYDEFTDIMPRWLKKQSQAAVDPGIIVKPVESRNSSELFDLKSIQIYNWN